MIKIKFDEHGNKIVNEIGSITFLCPSCQDAEISRTKRARSVSKEYICPKCGFVGP